jgi:hypothetical protein
MMRTRPEARALVIQGDGDNVIAVYGAMHREPTARGALRVRIAARSGHRSATRGGIPNGSGSRGDATYLIAMRRPRASRQARRERSKRRQTVRNVQRTIRVRRPPLSQRQESPVDRIARAAAPLSTGLVTAAPAANGMLMRIRDVGLVYHAARSCELWRSEYLLGALFSFAGSESIRAVSSEMTDALRARVRRLRSERVAVKIRVSPVSGAWLQKHERECHKHPP